MGYLLDSNVVIDYVAERFTEAQLKKLDMIFDEAFIISVITKIETLGFNSSADEDNNMHTFLKLATIINLSDEIVDETILLRKKMKIKTPDAIIAASALVNDYILITRNLSDFSKVPGLKLIDPHSF